MELSKKSLSTVFIEATVVGICLVFFVNICKIYLMSLVPNMTSDRSMDLLFVSGFVFHVVFEYTGLNLWYSKEYCKLI